ncbi:MULTISPECIES: TerB family tellurite resistance protein [unclassified Yoonia]|uniref:tellurite resistance TerB family protein n=1 Tax=unclassified Yoonia TaxID=2629118 RepID=UPI002B00016D|nr:MULTISPECIES: TerB family tellurite resistance protein [unclassified Yoonia]
MFADLIRRMTAPAPQTLPDPDARLALGALLVRIARTDGHYDPAEQSTIDQALIARYGLTAAEATALRLDCEVLESEAPDTVRFTRAIKDAVDYDNRLGVIEALWRVAMADGVRDDAEDSMMRMTASLLGVSDQDSHAARLRVSVGRS